MRLPVKSNDAATTLTRIRYERLAPWYEMIEKLDKRSFAPFRARMWSQASGPEVLEVGVGTGRYMTYYPADAQITAIDLTPGMLERAQKRAAALNIKVDLRLGDVQALDFPDASFDTVAATFVFCSVPEPGSGLREIKRVVKPDGKVLLLEHVRLANPIAGAIMDFINPLVVRLSGANINRRTVENVQKSGLVIEKIEGLGMGGMIKLIVARVG